MSLKELIVELGEDIWVLEHLNEEQARFLADNVHDISYARAGAAYALTAMGLPRKGSEEMFLGSFKTVIDSMIDKEKELASTSSTI